MLDARRSTSQTRPHSPLRTPVRPRLGRSPFHSRSRHKEKTQLTPCPSHPNATWPVAGLGKAALLVLASPVLLACFPACQSWALFMPS